LHFVEHPYSFVEFRYFEALQESVWQLFFRLANFLDVCRSLRRDSASPDIATGGG
jgi:hypothetical protein